MYWPTICIRLKEVCVGIYEEPCDEFVFATVPLDPNSLLTTSLDQKSFVPASTVRSGVNYVFAHYPIRSKQLCFDT